MSVPVASHACQHLIFSAFKILGILLFFSHLNTITSIRADTLFSELSYSQMLETISIQQVSNE